MHTAQDILPLTAAVIAQARDKSAATELQRAVEALRTQHPEFATPEDTKGGTLVAAAKNLRSQLRLAFPGHKFSVTTDRFSGGDSLRVSWTDGPAVSRVEAIASQYKAGGFNGYDDIYEYNRSAWAQAFGDAKYVSCSRDYSPELTEWVRADDVPYPARHDTQCNRRSTLYRLSIKAIKPAEDK